MKNKLTTIIVILATLILAGVAIFTAVRLYQLRQRPVAPNVPESKPAAAGAMCGGLAKKICPTGEVCIYSDGSTVAPSADASGTCQVATGRLTPPPQTICTLSFNLATPTPSPSPTPTKSPSPTPTPTKSPSPSPSPTLNPLCNSVCTTNAQCPSGLGCYIPSGSTSGNCRNMTCTSKTNCLCPTATPSPSPTPTKSPSPTPTPTKSPSPSPTINVTPSPSPSPVAQCNSACTSSAQCPSGLSCYISSGTTGYCRNVSCTSQTNCICPVATPTITASPRPTATNIAYVPTPIKSGPTEAPQPTLPESGTDWPTVAGAMLGIFVIIGSLLLAF